MKELDNFKFITDDDQEYALLFHKFIGNSYYGYAVNLNDETDSMCAKIEKHGEDYFFEKIDDINIIKEILKDN